MFNIDSKKRFEKKKFMFPDPYVVGRNNLALADSWGDVVEMIQKKSQDIDFADKKSQVYFFGAPHAPSTDSYKGKTLKYSGLDYLTKNNFKEHLSHFPRMDVIKLSAKHPDVVYARVHYNFKKLFQRRLQTYEWAGFDPYDFFAVSMSPNYHLNHKYLLSLDGINAAWSRVEWIMFSNSLLIKDDSTKEQWFYPLFKHKENTIMVDPHKLEDLLDIVEWCEAN